MSKRQFWIKIKCLNSMHSKQKLAAFESGSNVPVSDLIQERFFIIDSWFTACLHKFYSYCQTWLKYHFSGGDLFGWPKLSLRWSHQSKEILIFDCVFGEKAHDCRGDEIDGISYSLWEPVTTFFWKCLRFSTENLQLVYPKDLGHHKLQWSMS